MSIPQIHWHEGLFLQPQHLQFLQRQSVERINLERRLSWPYPYGVLEARLATDALENMQVRFERLVAILPGGTFLDFPNNAELPALDIRRALAASNGSVTLSISVPAWQSGRGNTMDPTGIEDARIKRMFKVSETQVADENTGDNVQPLQLRKLNARLITENEERAELDVLPILRITRGAGDEAGLARADQRFVPPCMIVNGSPVLKKLLRDLSDGVEAARKEQASQLARGGWQPDNLRGPQFLQMTKLGILNRYAARLPAMVQATSGEGMGYGAFDMYNDLRGLHAELAAMHPDRDPFEAPRYDHDNPGPVFTDLEQRIRQLLRDQGVKPAKKIPFVPDGPDLVADITAEDFSAADFLLGVRTKMDPKALKLFIEDAERFKMMNHKQRRLKLFGVKLEEERYVVGVPTPPGQHYFRLNRAQSESRWKMIQEERKIALVWPEMEHFEFEEVALFLLFT